MAAVVPAPVRTLPTRRPGVRLKRVKSWIPVLNCPPQAFAVLVMRAQEPELEVLIGWPDSEQAAAHAQILTGAVRFRVIPCRFVRGT